MVEGAIALVVLLFLLFGIVQFVLLVSAYVDSRNAANAGARLGAIDATDIAADYDILQAVKKEARLVQQSQIQKVVVFRANQPNQGPPPGCLNNSTGSTGWCNVYTTADLNAPVSAWDGSGGAKDATWPASSRNAFLLSPQGPDYLGVRVEVKSLDAGGPFKFTRTFAETSVIRIQASSY